MTAQSGSGPGSELEQAREKLGVSRREVSDALNLPMRVIEALETDDYEGLPPTVFTRGYLRSYARLLELDPAAVVARYPLPEPEPEAEQPEAPAPPRFGKRAIVLVAAIGIVVALIGVLVTFLSTGREGTVAEPQPRAVEPQPRAVEPAAEPQPLPDAPTPEVDEAAPAQAPPSFAPVEAEDAVGVETEAPALAEPAVEPTPSAEAAPPGEPSAAPDAGLEVEAPAPATGESRRITELGDDVLSFAFSEDCWVEVNTLDGENVYSNLNRAGTTLELVGRGPFRVLLGYAPGVTLGFNGEAVPLGRHTRNNVATVVLGQ